MEKKSFLKSVRSLSFSVHWAWAFLPWSLFWQNNRLEIRDLSTLRFGIARAQSCSQIVKTYTGTVALKASTQEHGLSHRTQPLKESEAMLFVADVPRFLSFWMLDTLIPLDVAFYDSLGHMTEFHHMPVEVDPKKPKINYPSQSKIQVAIEIKPGLQRLFLAYPYLCVEH